MIASLTEIEYEQALERLRDGARVGKWITDKRQFERLWDDVSYILSALTASEAEVERLKRALHLIEVQDQGCGGNLRPDEIYLAMQRIARAALTGEKP